MSLAFELLSALKVLDNSERVISEKVNWSGEGVIGEGGDGGSKCSASSIIEVMK